MEAEPRMVSDRRDAAATATAVEAAAAASVGAEDVLGGHRATHARARPRVRAEAATNRTAPMTRKTRVENKSLRPTLKITKQRLISSD